MLSEKEWWSYIPLERYLNSKMTYGSPYNLRVVDHFPTGTMLGADRLAEFVISKTSRFPLLTRYVRGAVGDSSAFQSFFSDGHFGLLGSPSPA